MCNLYFTKLIFFGDSTVVLKLEKVVGPVSLVPAVYTSLLYCIGWPKCLWE